MVRKEKSNDVLSPDAFWKNADQAFVPEILAHTTFKIPYKPLAVRQLVTRAEFAQEVNSAEDDPYKYVGRKISRKSFRHPLSDKEYVLMKSNRGNSPQLFFSYEGQRENERKPLLWERKYRPEDIGVTQVSRLSQLMRDERMVRLARIREGSNAKGKEHWRSSYFQYKDGIPYIAFLLLEEALAPDREGSSHDYMTQGVLLRRGEPLRLDAVVFCKLQFRTGNKDTLFFAAEYKEGKLFRTYTCVIPLRDLPIFEESIQEAPELLFEEGRTAVSRPDTSEKKELPVRISFGPRLEEDFYALILQGKPARIPLRLEDNVRTPYVARKSQEGVCVDPEVDKDLDTALASLQEVFGDALLEVYFYGSIPRGYKHLQSDIDLLAVVNDHTKLVRPIRGFEMERNFRQGRLIHGALGSYAAKSVVYPFRSVEIHTIQKNRWDASKNLRLGEFLRNVRDGCIKIYEKGK